jgi:hypothetical protein
MQMLTNMTIKYTQAFISQREIYCNTNRMTGLFDSGRKYPELTK